MVRRRRALAGFAALAAAPFAARAKAGDDPLRIAWRDALPDVTPYFNSLRAGLVLSHQAWDGLLYRDPDTLQLRPALAASHRWLDDTTLEFTLRRGIVFHNGDALSADDVVYTVQTAITDPRVAVPSNYAFLAGAERGDDFRVRILLRQPFPAALEYIAMVLPILPRTYRESVGAEAYARKPVGCGPYRFARIDGERSIELERFEGYYAESPKGRPAIARVRIEIVADGATEVARLVDGNADWIWQFDPMHIEEIARTPGLQVLSAESMRIGYLGFETTAGAPDAENPLAKLPVRQAIAHAVDRARIAREVGRGAARVPDAPCFPTQFGCDQTAATRFEHDPAKARELLAAAGLPNGFKTELVSYVLPAVGQIVRDDLGVVGISAELVELPAAEVVRRSAVGRNPLELGSWGSYSINDVSAILPRFFAGGPQDHAHDPELAALIRQGDSDRDVGRRRAAYAEAIRRITQRALWLPLTTYVTTYGFSHALAFKPSTDELPRFFLATWR